MSACKHLSMADRNQALALAIIEKHQECVDGLIAAGVDVNTTNSNGYTPMMLAGYFGATGCLDSLIKAGANKHVFFPYSPVSPAGTQHSVLHLAAIRGYKDCLELLLQNGFTIDNELVAVTAGHSECMEFLIKSGLDVNGSSRPLSSAAAKGKIDTMELLIREGADVNLLRFGRTALHSAAGRGQDSSIRFLLESGADVNLSGDETPLMLAAEEGSGACVRTLINAGSDVHHTDAKGQTALTRALNRNHHECVDLLVKAGVDFDNKDELSAFLLSARGGIGVGVEKETDVNAPDQNGCTALHSAIKMGRPQAVLDSLLKLGAEANVIDDCGYTPLLYAVEKEQINYVSALISAGADVNHKYPLLLASKHGSSEIVKTLIDAGADVNLQDNQGDSPLIHAVKEGKKRYTLGWFSGDVTNSRRYHTCVNLLLEAGADVNMANKDGSTALLQTSAPGNEKGMRLLLKADADVYRKDIARNRSEFGQKPVLFDPSTWMKLLLEAGADVNIANKEGCTALMAATESGESDCLELLLKADADVNLVNRNQRTALTMARDKDQVLMLLQYGAPVNWANKVGLTALLYVGYDGDWKGFDAYELVELLLEAGADVNATDINNSSILFHAACTTDRFVDPKVVKVAIKRGVHVNIRNLCGQNSLEYYLAMAWERDEKLALLLFAAGELLDVNNSRKVVYKLDGMGTQPLDLMDPKGNGRPVAVPDCLLDKNATIYLKSFCRKVIRQHLMKIDLHTNLFERTPRLGLPRQLQRYLLYETTLDLERRCNLTIEEFDLLGPKQKACRICYKLHSVDSQ